MNRSDDIRPGYIENFIATFMTLEIFQGWISGLQHRSHGSVGYNRARREGYT
jgi:hypothetical protein